MQGLHNAKSDLSAFVHVNASHDDERWVNHWFTTSSYIRLTPHASCWWPVVDTSPPILSERPATACLVSIVHQHLLSLNERLIDVQLLLASPKAQLPQQMFYDSRKCRMLLKQKTHGLKEIISLKQYQGINTVTDLSRFTRWQNVWF